MIKKYGDFLLEDVTQNNLKIGSDSSDDSDDKKKVLSPEFIESKKQVENNIKTETTSEVGEKSSEIKKTKAIGGEKKTESEKLNISQESTKVFKKIYDFYNRLGFSLNILSDMKGRNTNDVQQKNSKLRISGVKKQTEQPIQKPTRTIQHTEIEKDMTKRQLGFKKDSTEQLKSKLNNPSYAKYKNEISAILSGREKIETTKTKVNVKEQKNIGNT